MNFPKITHDAVYHESSKSAKKCSCVMWVGTVCDKNCKTFIMWKQSEQFFV